MGSEARSMTVTLEVSRILSSGLMDEGFSGLDVRPTYALTQGADGEITVYGPGRHIIASEEVQKNDVPDEIAGRILEKVRVANSGN